MSLSQYLQSRQQERGAPPRALPSATTAAISPAAGLAASANAADARAAAHPKVQAAAGGPSAGDVVPAAGSSPAPSASRLSPSRAAAALAPLLPSPRPTHGPLPHPPAAAMSAAATAATAADAVSSGLTDDLRSGVSDAYQASDAIAETAFPVASAGVLPAAAAATPVATPAAATSARGLAYADDTDRIIRQGYLYDQQNRRYWVIAKYSSVEHYSEAAEYEGSKGSPRLLRPFLDADATSEAPVARGSVAAAAAAAAAASRRARGRSVNSCLPGAAPLASGTKEPVLLLYMDATGVDNGEAARVIDLTQCRDLREHERVPLEARTPSSLTSGDRHAFAFFHANSASAHVAATPPLTAPPASAAGGTSDRATAPPKGQWIALQAETKEDYAGWLTALRLLMGVGGPRTAAAPLPSVTDELLRKWETSGLEHASGHVAGDASSSPWTPFAAAATSASAPQPPAATPSAAAPLTALLVHEGERTRAYVSDLVQEIRQLLTKDESADGGKGLASRSESTTPIGDSTQTIAALAEGVSSSSLPASSSHLEIIQAKLDSLMDVVAFLNQSQIRLVNLLTDKAAQSQVSKEIKGHVTKFESKLNALQQSTMNIEQMLESHIEATAAAHPTPSTGDASAASSRQASSTALVPATAALEPTTGLAASDPSTGGTERTNTQLLMTLSDQMSSVMSLLSTMSTQQDAVLRAECQQGSPTALSGAAASRGVRVHGGSDAAQVLAWAAKHLDLDAARDERQQTVKFQHGVRSSLETIERRLGDVIREGQSRHDLMELSAERRLDRTTILIQQLKTQMAQQAGSEVAQLELRRQQLLMEIDALESKRSQLLVASAAAPSASPSSSAAAVS